MEHKDKIGGADGAQGQDRRSRWSTRAGLEKQLEHKDLIGGLRTG